MQKSREAMKRDLELVRQILLRIEGPREQASLGLSGGRSVEGLPNLEFEGPPEEEVDYHLDLLIKAGLINGTGSRTLGGGFMVNIRGLTWAGHDFLDAVRDEQVWGAMDKKVRDSGLDMRSLTFDVVKSICVSFIEDRLGLGG